MILKSLYNSIYESLFDTEDGSLTDVENTIVGMHSDEFSKLFSNSFGKSLHSYQLKKFYLDAGVLYNNVTEDIYMNDYDGTIVMKDLLPAVDKLKFNGSLHAYVLNFTNKTICDEVTVGDWFELTGDTLKGVKVNAENIKIYPSSYCTGIIEDCELNVTTPTDHILYMGNIPKSFKNVSGNIERIHVYNEKMFKKWKCADLFKFPMELTTNLREEIAIKNIRDLKKIFINRKYRNEQFMKLNPKFTVKSLFDTSKLNCNHIYIFDDDLMLNMIPKSADQSKYSMGVSQPYNYVGETADGWNVYFGRNVVFG